MDRPERHGVRRVHEIDPEHPPIAVAVGVAHVDLLEIQKAGRRGGIRYFTQLGENADGGAVNAYLDGLDFWRANAGVAFRW